MPTASYFMYDVSDINWLFSTGGSNPTTMTAPPNSTNAGAYSSYTTGTVSLKNPYDTTQFTVNDGWASVDTALPNGHPLSSTQTLFGTTYPAGTEINLLYGIRLSDGAGGDINLYAVAQQFPNGTVKVIGFMTTKPLKPGVTYTMSYGGGPVIYEEFGVSAADLYMPDGIVEGTSGNNLIDGNYTGDPDGDMIDGNDNTGAGVAAGGVAGSNDDLVQGFGGNDTIRSGAGNDTVYAGNGADSVDGGTGNDVLYGYGDTLGGTDDGSADTLIGGLGNDSLYGGGGNDVLYGDDTLGTDTAGGNDYIDGGTGNDTINAGYGNDTVLGGDGADSILAGAGDDSVDGGTGNDTISGGGGHDTIFGGAGDDSIDGGPGNDSLSGGAGNDRIDGGVGSDILNGGDGNDTLLGGDGDDRIVVGAGDSASGGNGDDDFILDPTQTGGGLWIINGGEGFEGTPEDTTNNADDGGMAGDKIDGSALTSGVNVTYSTTENGTMTGATSGTFTDIEKVVTGSGNDTINAAGATVVGGAGINIDTGLGNDVITGSAGNDTIDAGAGNDLVNVSGGADSVAGGAGSDTLSGASQTANTTVTVGAGNAGTFSNANGTTTFSSFETFATGSGNDSINASNATTGITADTGAGNDTIIGSGLNDVLNGGDGNDSLSGGGGNDTLLGGAGSDTLNGGAGNDLLDGGDGDDDIYVGAGDTAYGGAGDDEFIIDPTQAGPTPWVIDGGTHGTPAPDDANGSAGDILNATNVGAVDIQFTGGFEGSVVGATTGTFTDVEIFKTGAGNDTIDASISWGDLQIDAGGGNNIVTGGYGSDTITTGAGNDSIDGGEGHDLIFAGAGSDTIKAGLYGNDTIHAGEGDDVVFVGGGTNSSTDMIYGDEGDDRFIVDLSISSGAWEIFGGDHGTTDDTVNGSAGDILDTTSDTVGVTITVGSSNVGSLSQNGNVFGTFQEIEIINTGSGGDLINLAGGSQVNQVHAGAGDDTVYTSGNTDTFVDGGAGNDLLVGDPNVDWGRASLYGGAGSDTIYGGITQGDYLDGGDGDDLIHLGTGDTAVGGSGDDKFVVDSFTPNSGQWHVIGGETGEDMSDPTNGGTGDELIVENGTTPITVTFTGSEAGTVNDGTLYGGIFEEIEKVTTGAGNDTIDATLDNSTGLVLNSGDGDDVVIGGTGADTILGGTGADTITGGAGNDLIDLGAGDGAVDTVVMTNGSGADTVIGFTAPVDTDGDGQGDSGSDKFDVSALLDPVNNDGVQTWDFFGPNPTGTITGVDTDGDGTIDASLITFPNGETVLLPGVLPEQIDTAQELHAIGIPCFTTGTLIETAHGAVAIETLVAGDLVLTRDNGLQPVRWIGSRTLAGAALAENLRPILIRKGALGANTPSSDLLVSPQHRVLVRSRIAQKMFGTDEVLVAAKQLCQIEGIDIANPAQVTYVHMLFDRHEVVISNGAETESLYTGAEALKSVGRAARDEIFAIFPELAEADGAPVAARPLVSGRMGRKLAVRHVQNGKPLVG